MKNVELCSAVNDVIVKKMVKMKVTTADKTWAKKVKDRDGWACCICLDEKMPNAHHIIPKQIASVRHDLVNGITLCPKHHRFCWKLSAHQNPLMFLEWFKHMYPTRYRYLRSILC